MPADMKTRTVAPKPKPEPRNKQHEVSLTAYINGKPVAIDFAYDLDPADPDGSQVRKEEAFAEALNKRHPGLKKLRSAHRAYETA